MLTYEKHETGEFAGEYIVADEHSEMVASFVNEEDAVWYVENAPHGLQEWELAEVAATALVTTFDTIESAEVDGPVVLVSTVEGQAFRVRVEEYSP